MKAAKRAMLVAILAEACVVGVFPATAAAEGPEVPPSAPVPSAAAVPDPAAAATAPVTLIVELDPGASVDRDRVQAAIARELGVPVVWDRGGKGGTLVVRGEGPRVVVSFDGPDGRHEGRAIPLPPEPEKAERDIALLAGNVARDQASPFLPAPIVAVPAMAPGPLPAPSPCTAAGPTLAFGADVAPFVGVSTFDRGRSIRFGSLGLGGALSGGVRGFAVSGGVDIAAGPVCGMQIAGAVNVASGAVSGVQIAGAVNVAAGEFQGAQIGTVNVSAGAVHGLQIGVINYATDADFQLGLLNINASGRFLLDIWSQPEMGLFWLAFKHGGKHYHWIYGLGSRPADLSRPWYSIGVGRHSTPTDKVYVDLDVLVESQFVFNDTSQVAIAQGRVVGGYHFIPGLAVFGGPTFNFLFAGKNARSGAPAYASDIGDVGSRDVRGWVGATLGIEAP